MGVIEKIKIASGVYWVGIPPANLYVLCGCPEESVKHLMKKGLIKTIERDGFAYETGPNAILLSDVLIQNGQFSNLAEFPALQMLYRQGMIIPNHPNNTGTKPLLLGTKKQIDSQLQYIYRGNYGLISADEIVQAGVPREEAEELMRMKLKFAFGKIRQTSELLDYQVIEQDFVKIRNGVSLRRIGFNHYEFQYKGESVAVDLNLAPKEVYEPPYELGYHHIRREYFAVLHTGVGDGWDAHRLCTSSIIFYQGKIYLVDAVPNILYCLNALGISVNEIEGIFHTHAHDDHFAGITTIIRADHRVKYYTTPLVRASIEKKLSALLSWKENYLDRFFEIHDLACDSWNNIEGLEVYPALSPHPIETNIFTFRTLWEDGYQTYAHLADVVSLKKLKDMVTNDPAKPGITDAFFKRVKASYLMPADIKKIDIGGGLIHGCAEDFKKDASRKIVLAHTAEKLTVQQKSIGSDAPFGAIDVLIPANQDYTMRYASRLFQKYFLNVPNEYLQMLLNCDIKSYNAGHFLIKKGEVNSRIYFIISGIVELLQPDLDRRSMLSSGSFVGEFSGIMEIPSLETYCAASYLRVLEIPNRLYFKFVGKNKLYRDMERVMDNRLFIQSTWLFGDMVSYPVENKVARLMRMKPYAAGEKLAPGKTPELFLLYQGGLQLCKDGKVIEALEPGDFAGEETIIYNIPPVFDVVTTKKSKIFHISGDILADIPIVQWKLLEMLEKRLKISGGNLSDMSRENRLGGK